jgi:hypothetical protein
MNNPVCLAIVRLAAEKALLRDVAEALALIQEDIRVKRSTCKSLALRLEEFVAKDPAGSVALFPLLARDLSNAASWRRWTPAWTLAAAVESAIGGRP